MLRGDYLSIYQLSVPITTDTYKRLENVLSQHHSVSDPFRYLGWLLIRLLSMLCNACEKLYQEANKTLSFIYSPKVASFIEEWKLPIAAVLIISLILFGVSLMLNKKYERNKLLSGIFIALIVLTGLTNSMQTLTDKVSNYSLELAGSSSTSANSIIKNSIFDLYYLDDNDFSEKAVSNKNTLNENNILNIDINEIISSSDDVKNPNFFTKKLDVDKNGNSVLVDIDDGGLVNFNNDNYYRYDIDFITIFLTLFATAIVMIFTSFKVVKIMYEIIINHILALILAAGNWAEGNKLKEVIKSLFALFFSVFMCSVMIHIYFIYSSWISANVSNALVRALLLVFAAFAVIDGPNVVEKIFGVDAGLASTFRSVSTMFFAARGAASAVKGAGHAVNSIARGGAHLGGEVGGFINGMKNHGNSNAGQGATGSKGSVSKSTEGSQNTDKNSPDKHNNQNANSSGGKTKSDNLNISGSNNKTDADNLNNQGNGNPSSIANEGSKRQNSSANSNFDYAGYKSRNPRSAIGAGVRGTNKGQYWGNKISNAAQSRKEKSAADRNAKGE